MGSALPTSGRADRPPIRTTSPLAVWLQSPSNAEAYQEVGINTYIGLWEGPRDDQLDALTAAGMHVMPDQNATGLARLTDSIITGWIQQDEPDNAQSDGAGGWGPCIEPSEVIARYQAMKAADPSRPVFLNLGQNVAWDYDNPYIGRGSECSERWDQYPEYVKGADIVALDIYPVTSEYDEIRGNLWRVALGVDRLREWTNGEKIVWNLIETAHINSTVRPTASQIESEVWMSLIHGSMGIVYFAHEWYPEFREPALLYYPDIREGVRAINAEITELAPVLNSETLPDAVQVESARADVPVDVMAKWHDDATYIFAVAMRDGSTEATFRFHEEVAGLVEVIGENRTIELVAGEFRDTFAGYEVHKYRVVTSDAPASNAIYLPSLRRQDGLPTAVAGLGQAAHDVVSMDGVVYAAIGREVVAFEPADGDGLRYVAQSPMLPALVTDVDAGDGVVYAAYDTWSSFEGQERPGGLAVLAPPSGGSLGLVGRVPLADGWGYTALDWDGGVLAATRCLYPTCSTTDFMSTADPRAPVNESSVARKDLPTDVWSDMGIAALGDRRFTDGLQIIDVANVRSPVVSGELPEAGRPVAADGILATVSWSGLAIYGTEGPEPNLLAALDMARLGYNEQPTALGVSASLILVGGDSDVDAIDDERPGRWTSIPIAGGVVGEPKSFEVGPVPVAFAMDSPTWVGLNESYVYPDYGPSAWPFVSAIGSVPGPLESADDVDVQWTGWDANVADVLVDGDVAIALVGKSHGVALETYDLGSPERPARIGQLSDACEMEDEGDGRVLVPRECSLVEYGDGLVLISSALASAVVDVTDLTSPRLLRRGPPLGVQLTTIPGGIVAIESDATQHGVALLGYESLSPELPTLSWREPVQFGQRFFKMVASDLGDTAVVVTADWLTGINWWVIPRGTAPHVRGTTPMEPIPDGLAMLSLAADHDRVFWISGDSLVHGIASRDGLRQVGTVDVPESAGIGADAVGAIVDHDTYVAVTEDSVGFFDVSQPDPSGWLGSKPSGVAYCGDGGHYCYEYWMPLVVDLGRYFYVANNPFSLVFEWPSP